jgi:undecaprenyl diphosphate synthase
MNTELNIPNHVAIILDGNRRWAKKRGMKPQEGHYKVFTNLENLADYVFSKGVKVLSVYAFSTENFSRAKDEVDYLMDLFAVAFKKYFDRQNKKNVKIVFSGRREPLPTKVLKMIDEVTEKTKDNTGPIFNICVNYGGRPEIVDTTKKICEMVKNGEISIDDIDEDLFTKNLYQDLPPIDLMIRTSGEVRLSNFLLWQNAYAEFYFPEVEFPGFDEKEFDKALEVFDKRNRRFGGQ